MAGEVLDVSAFFQSAAFDNSKSLEDFNAEVIKLRDYWQIAPSLLPPLPTTK